MNVMCVDDEELVLRHTLSLCGKLPRAGTVKGFTRAKEALAWAEKHAVDIAVLDIRLPDMDGITLAKRIRNVQSNTAIIFVTGYDSYAVDAFEIHANGYLLKPVTYEQLAAEAEYAMQGRAKPELPHIFARTFGNFDLMVDGDVVIFSRAKEKELFAYLVERQGKGITRREACEALWEDREYDRPMQKQLDALIRSMRATLVEYQIGDVFEVRDGQLRIVPEKMDCDLYRFLDGDVKTVNCYRGEYMSAYPWANLMEAYITRISGLY